MNKKVIKNECHKFTNFLLDLINNYKQLDLQNQHETILHSTIEILVKNKIRQNLDPRDDRDTFHTCFQDDVDVIEHYHPLEAKVIKRALQSLGPEVEENDRKAFHNKHGVYPS